MSRMHVVSGLVVFLSMLHLAGCIPYTPPAEAVLAGTWDVNIDTTVNPLAEDITQLSITFDQNGALQSVQYQIGDNAAIIVPTPIGDTVVSDKAVTISVSFGGNTLAFEGMLNDANTVITGNVTTLISAGQAVIQINNGPATFTKR